MKGFAIVLVALSLLFAFSPIGPAVMPQATAIEQSDEQACRIGRVIRGAVRGAVRGVGRLVGANRC